MPPLLVETYSTAAERLALNAFRIGDINGLVPCAPSQGYGASRQSSAGSSRATADKSAWNDQKCRDAFVRTVRAARVPPAADRRRSEAVFGRVLRAGAREPPLPRRRARRRRGDAAVAELPVSRRSRAGRHDTRTTTSRAGCRTCSGTRCRTMRCSRRQRRASSARPRDASAPRGACSRTRRRAARRSISSSKSGCGSIASSTR